ncbi:MAG: c-type cytochrome biogenesis protein CcsB [Propionibacteriaceae bacterium]
MDLGTYSNLAMVSATVVYLLAVFAHSAEWASARKVGTSSGEAVLAPAMSTRELAIVPAAGSGGSYPKVASGVGSGGGQPGDQSARLDTSERIDLFGRLGVALTVVGFLLAAGGMILRGLAAGRPPWGNMYEFTTAALVFAVATYLVLVARKGVRWLGLPMTLLATVGNGLAVTVFYVAVAPLVPALHSVWFVAHIVAAAISGAAFNVGGVASILYLVKHRAETTAVARGTAVTGYLAKLPTTKSVDVLAYKCLAFAFPVWTFTIAAGAVWAEYAWGRFWGWDPKETWALVTWVIYACYLHARATAGWKGSRAAVIAVVGLAAFWFNFIGINLLVSGLHSYAGV